MINSHGSKLSITLATTMWSVLDIDWITTIVFFLDGKYSINFAFSLGKHGDLDE